MKKRRVRSVKALSELFETHDRLLPMEAGLLGIAVFPDGSRILTTGFDKIPAIWDLSGINLVQCEGHTKQVDDGDIFPDCSKVVTTSNGGDIRIFDAVTGKQLAMFGSGPGGRGVRVFPDGRRVLTTSWDCATRIWDAITSTELMRFECTARAQIGAVFPNGRWIMACCHDGSCPVWDADTGEKKQDLQSGSHGLALGLARLTLCSRMGSAALPRAIRL